MSAGRAGAWLADGSEAKAEEMRTVIRQLRVAAGAVNHALMETPRLLPQMPQPTIQPPSSDVGAAS